MTQQRPLEIAAGLGPAPVRACWLRLPFAAVLGLFRPRAAAVSVVSASQPAFAAILVLSLLCCALVLIGLMLWEGTLTQTWVGGSPLLTSLPATGPATGPFWLAPGRSKIESRTAAEVWRQWRAEAYDGWLGPAEITVILVLVLGTLFLLVLGWLNLPFVHSTGSVWRSYKRALRAGTALLWPLTLLTALSGAAVVLQEHALYRSGTPFAMATQDDPGFILYLCVAASAGLLALWLSTAITGVQPAAPDLILPPRCEGCGYDLTHQPADRRCPECGLDIDASLVEPRSRPGSRWARGKSNAGWLASFREVLLRPRVFYRALKLRTPAAADTGFAARHYVRLWVYALLWACALFVVLGNRTGFPTPAELPAVALGGCAAVLLGVVGCWLGHRTIQAFVTTSWLVHGELPDFRWAAKVGTYETSFLWVFCCFWGIMFTSFALFDAWISGLLGRRGWGPPVPELLVMLGGTFALGVLWLWRYGVAYRAIRWSNF